MDLGGPQQKAMARRASSGPTLLNLHSQSYSEMLLVAKHTGRSTYNPSVAQILNFALVNKDRVQMSRAADPASSLAVMAFGCPEKPCRYCSFFLLSNKYNG